MDKELLTKKIVREIIAMVSCGTFERGSRLPSERKLADFFEVSRGTLRQAFSQLENMGVIEIQPGSGAYFKGVPYKKLPDEILPPNFDRVKLEDIITARKAIEVAAVEVACQRAPKTKIAYLESLVDKMVEFLDDLPKFLKYDMEFHTQLVNAGENMVLATAFEAISEYHKFSQVYTSMHEGEEETAIDYHRRILYALTKRKPELARKAVLEHLECILISSRGGG